MGRGLRPCSSVAVASLVGRDGPEPAEVPARVLDLSTIEAMTSSTVRMLYPSHQAVLDGLRHVCLRQVVRHRHDAIVDTLARWGFVMWVRQPIRRSQLEGSPLSGGVPVPEYVAELTDNGRGCLDWLAALERTRWWDVLRMKPYPFPRGSRTDLSPDPGPMQGHSPAVA